MINKPLSKNFKFEVDIPFIDKNDFEKEMLEVENFYRNEQLDVIPNKIRRLFEKMLDKIIEREQIDSEGRMKIIDKVYAIDRNFPLGQEKLNSFYITMNFGNAGSHPTNATIIDKYEVLSLLKAFHIVVISLINIYNENNPIKFDFKNDYDTKLNKQKIISSTEYFDYKTLQNNDDVSINDISIFNLLFKNKRVFTIPFYQRNYTWDEQNVEDLIEDILERVNDQSIHYMGVIACTKEKTSEKFEKIKVIDGQQRITTSLLIFMAIYYNLKRKNKEFANKIFNEIFSCLGDNKFNNIYDNETWKLNDKKRIEDILSGNYDIYGDEEYIRNEKESRILANFKYLNERVDELFKDDDENNKKLLDFYNTFATKFIVAFVDFSRKIDVKKELEVFENMNSKGKNLSIVDLAKNYLFNECDKKVVNNDLEALNYIYNDYIINKISENQGQEKILTEFYKNLVYHFKGDELKNIKETYKFSKSFKEQISKGLSIKANVKQTNWTFDEYKKIMNEMKRYFEYGYLTIKIDKYEQKIKNDWYIKDFISILPSPKKSAIYPFSFLIASKIKDHETLSKEEKKQIFYAYKHIVKLITFHFILKGQGDSSLRRDFIKKSYEIYEEAMAKNENLVFVCKKIREIEAKDIIGSIDLEILKRRIKLELKANDWATKLLLLLISYDLINKNDPVLINEKISLEHIMPKTLGDNWLEDIKTWNPEMCKLTYDEIKNEAKKYLEQLGNFLLIGKDLNSKLKNNKFEKKKEILKQQSHFQNLFINENENIDFFNKSKWTFKDIENRTNEFVDIALRILNKKD